MPRTQLILISAFAFLFSGAFANAAEPCGDRLQAFNEYEEMSDDGKVVNKHSLFEVQEWSDASAFQGILVKKDQQNLVLEAEILKKAKGPSVKKGEWKFKDWESDKKYAVTDDFDPQKFFEEAEDGQVFILRLKSKGKVVCEDKAREIQGH